MIFFKRPDAIAYVRGKQGCPVGTVKFYQTARNVMVEAEFSGLPENGSGFFGLHIHEGHCCGTENFSQTGNHYDPHGRAHPLHAGDLPPLLRLRNGKSYLAVRTDRFPLRQVLGRTVVLHAMAEDFRSQPGGNAGEKLACGVIQGL